MSSKLALKQLASLQESREQQPSKEIRKTIRKKRRSAKKQQQQVQQKASKQQQQQQALEYYQATTTTQKSTAEIMNKVRCNASPPAVLQQLLSGPCHQTTYGVCALDCPAAAGPAPATGRVRQRP